MSSRTLEEETKEFLLRLSDILNVRISKVLDFYFSVRPAKARILELVEEGGKIVGIRMAVQSNTRRDLWHYVMVGRYGAKCTCEANTIRGQICRHIIIALITWNMISLIKTGKGVELESLSWLRGTRRVESSEENAGGGI